MASGVLLAQGAALRALREDATNFCDATEGALRQEVRRGLERERQLELRLASAHRTASAAAVEAESLQTLLTQAKADAEARAKRAAWDIRKRDEAAAAAVTATATTVREAQATLQAQVARQEVQLRKQESDLKAAHAQIRTLQHRLHDRTLLQQQQQFAEREFEGITATDNEIRPNEEAVEMELQPPGAGEYVPLVPLQDDFIARTLGYV